MSPKKSKVAPLQLKAAYAVCRSITRATAKNFYYGFLVLPRRKRDAICAVYAFMRHSDDISDDAGLPLAERRERLQAWRDALHAVLAGQPTDDPVLLAVADTQRRFRVAPELLDQLVHGTGMDLQVDHEDIMKSAPSPSRPAGAEPEGGPRLMYPTFTDLYDYCYHVASVVGLITIKIFGYRDPCAELLAENCGVAFQLTNIIRDVKEDAEMGRVYIPAEDLARFGRSVAELRNGADPAAFRPLLEFEAQRARDFYQAADELLPLIDEDSRPALWALFTIYRRLLEKIAARGYDVFSERVSLTRGEKLRILSQGLWRRLVT